MSDTGRKNLGDQVQEKATPDSQKSTLDQAKETITGTGDRAAGAAQPDSEKSTTQKAGDTIRGDSDTSKQGEGVVESAKKSVSDAAQTVSDALSSDNKK